MKFDGRRLTRAEQRVVKTVAETVERWRLVEDGDRVMVCLSGGKDSYALLDVLRILAARAPIDFEIVAVHLDQGWEGGHHAAIAQWMERAGLDLHVVRRDHAAIVDEKVAAGTTPCSLCSRLRRGALYDIAVDLRCTKVALGHHLDDAIDSLLLNLLHNGRLASLPPRLRSKDGRNVLIRPLVAVDERSILALAELRGYPLVRCTCPFVCASTGERLRVRAVIDEMERLHPRVRASVRRALSNVQTEFLWVDLPPGTAGTGRDLADDEVAPPFGPPTSGED
jgi:tRNA 2-thiocytidine biosynthesis protein TtcA